MNRPLTEKELRIIARETLSIIRGENRDAGTRPFYCGKDRLHNITMNRAIDYRDTNITMFSIVKDWSTRGTYTLQALTDIPGVIAFQIPFNSRITATELYVLIGDAYDDYDKQFAKYNLVLSDGECLKIRTSQTIHYLMSRYIGKWYKDSRWYLMLAKGDDKIFPYCQDVLPIS